MVSVMMSLMNPPIDASLAYIYTVTLYVTTYDIDSENNDSCVRSYCEMMGMF